MAKRASTPLKATSSGSGLSCGKPGKMPSKSGSALQENNCLSQVWKEEKEEGRWTAGGHWLETPSGLSWGRAEFTIGHHPDHHQGPREDACGWLDSHFFFKKTSITCSYPGK